MALFAEFCISSFSSTSITDFFIFSMSEYETPYESNHVAAGAFVLTVKQNITVASVIFVCFISTWC